MSSVSKGNAFEDRVFDAIQKELAADRLGLSPRLSLPFKKKGYYSRDRDSDIIVDVSIELWIPGADRWSMLWVCECKDYAKSVPVDDVEEFKAKLDQISGANRKGIMAVTSELQPAALSYARSHGIGIVRMLPDNQIRHVLYQLTTEAKPEQLDPAEFSRALTQPRFIGINRSFYSVAEGYIFGNWHSLLRHLLLHTDAAT